MGWKLKGYMNPRDNNQRMITNPTLPRSLLEKCQCAIIVAVKLLPQIYCFNGPLQYNLVKQKLFQVLIPPEERKTSSTVGK